MRCVWNDMYNVKMWEEEKGRVEVRVTVTSVSGLDRVS